MRILPAVFLSAVAVLAASRILLRAVDAALNRVRRPAPPPVSDATRRFHEGLRMVDLHCDALLWSRDLHRRARRGHVDLPRLREGRVALQVFAAPNRFPLGANYHRTPPGPDLMTAVAVGAGWPPATWLSPLSRALHQARTLRRTAASSAGRLCLVETRDDLDSPRGATGAVLAIEGLYGTGSDPAAVDRLFDAGFRIFGLAHMSDSDAAGSAHGWRKTGLTDFGRRVLDRLDERGAIVDLAHASERTIDETLESLARPPIVSHTGVRGTCPGNRNLSDRNLERVAGRGGLIGIAFFPAAVGGLDVGAIVRAIRHAVAVAGAEHVALGSDFDGAVRVPFDSARLDALTGALLESGLGEDDVERIMGRNALDFLLGALPPAC